MNFFNLWQCPSEAAICFDLQVPNGEIYTLFHEPFINLIVNAKFEGDMHHSWIKEIGIKSQIGTEIKINALKVETSRNGAFHSIMNLDSHEKILLQDIVLNIR